MNSIIEAQQDFFECIWIPEIVAPGLRMTRSGRSEFHKKLDEIADEQWKVKNQKAREALKTQRWDDLIRGTTPEYIPFRLKPFKPELPTMPSHYFSQYHFL
jgi:hypothetical protein